jgi:hypothetical protein
MNSRFLRRPNISYTPKLNPRRPWRLESECVYITDVTSPPQKIVVPKGYRTDLASVPRVPGIYWRAGGKAVLPAIVHDAMYEHNPHNLTRKQADLIFLEAMQDDDDPPWPTTRWAMYQAVRIGGWSSWRNYRKAK